MTHVHGGTTTENTVSIEVETAIRESLRVTKALREAEQGHELYNPQGTVGDAFLKEQQR